MRSRKSSTCKPPDQYSTSARPRARASRSGGQSLSSIIKIANRIIPVFGVAFGASGSHDRLANPHPQPLSLREGSLDFRAIIWFWVLRMGQGASKLPSPASSASLSFAKAGSRAGVTNNSKSTWAANCNTRSRRSGRSGVTLLQSRLSLHSLQRKPLNHVLLGLKAL